MSIRRINGATGKYHISKVVAKRKCSSSGVLRSKKLIAGGGDIVYASPYTHRYACGLRTPETNPT